MQWISEFIDDFLNFSSDELENKYSKKIPMKTTISSIFSTARTENKLNSFIDTVWYGDKRDNKIYFLLKNTDGKFEVFISERGSKHWLTIHDNLESAIIEKIDLILNNLGFSASDSKIKGS